MPLSNFRLSFTWSQQDCPSGLLTTFCIHLHLVSMLPLSNSRIHALVSPQRLACAVVWVQYLGFPFSSQQLLALILFRCRTSPLPPASLSPIFCTHLASISTCSPFLSTSSCMHLVSISEFPPPCARSKKNMCRSKKKVPRSKNIQPNVSAYNNGVSSPHPNGSKVHKAGARDQKKEAKVRNN